MTNTTGGDGSKPGWFQRTFGGERSREQLERASQETREKEERLLELEREVEQLREAAARDGSEAARTRDRAHAAELALAEQRALAADLEAKLVESARATQAAELGCQAEQEKVKRHERVASSALRRADQRGAELVAERKKLAELEARCLQLTQRRDTLAQELQDRARELEERSQQLAAADQTLRSLQGELDAALRALAGAKESVAGMHSEQSRVQTELGEQLAAIARLQYVERTQRAELQDREHQMAQLGRDRERQERALAQLRAQLEHVLELSAQALDVVLGPALSLGIEVGFRTIDARALVVSSGDATQATLEPVQRVREHLTALGFAEDFQFSGTAEAANVRLRLAASLAERDSQPLARWIAAYASECLNRWMRRDYRVASIAGGPVEFELALTSRSEQRGGEEAALLVAS